MKFFALITRCFNEPSIRRFVDYYLGQGVDEIHIIDDRTDEKILAPLRFDDRVVIYGCQNFKSSKTQLIDVNLVYDRIKTKFEWVALVDCDEFIVTRKAPLNTIKDELIKTFMDCDLVKVPWVMFSSHGRSEYEKVWYKDKQNKTYSLRRSDPENFLISNTLRWNHDLRHPHPSGWSKGRCRYERIEVKCIFRPHAFDGFLSPHYPVQNTDAVAVDSINKTRGKIDEFYVGLRESSIETAIMTCNHYRIVSLESCERKFNGNKLAAYLDPNNLNNLIASDHAEVEDFLLADKLITACAPSN